MPKRRIEQSEQEFLAGLDERLQSQDAEVATRYFRGEYFEEEEGETYVEAPKPEYKEVQETSKLSKRE